MLVQHILFVQLSKLRRIPPVKSVCKAAGALPLVLRGTLDLLRSKCIPAAWHGVKSSQCSGLNVSCASRVPDRHRLCTPRRSTSEDWVRDHSIVPAHALIVAGARVCGGAWSGLEFSALRFFVRSGHVGVLFFPACEPVVTCHVLTARALLVRDRQGILPSFATDATATGGSLKLVPFSRISNILVSMCFLSDKVRHCAAIREQRLRSCAFQQSRHFATFTLDQLALMSTIGAEWSMVQNSLSRHLQSVSCVAPVATAARGEYVGVA